MSASPKILVIDDSPTVLVMARYALSKAGYEVLTRGTAVGATSVIRQEQPDLVLLDLSMPELRGDELLNIVNGLGIATSGPIVLYSDADAAELDAVSKRCGAAGWLRKKGPEQLLVDVRRWVSGPESG